MKRLDEIIVVEDIKYRKHHTAWHKGYISRKKGSELKPYRGRFGRGYALLEASWTSTRYCYITYYVKEA